MIHLYLNNVKYMALKIFQNFFALIYFLGES